MPRICLTGSKTRGPLPKRGNSSQPTCDGHAARFVAFRAWHRWENLAPRFSPFPSWQAWKQNVDREFHMDNIIGATLFVDDAFRAVYLDRGREYFLGDNGQPVYGDWSYLHGPDIVARDTAAMVQRASETSTLRPSAADQWPLEL